MVQRVTFTALGWIGGLWLAAAASSAPASAATGTVTASDGICQYRITFDLAVYDKSRMKETVDYLYASDLPIELGPPLNELADVAAIDLAQFRSECATHRKALSSPRFVDVPGLEDVRRRQLAELDASCALVEAKLAGAKGDLDALRAYKPAASACGRYVDTLALPDDKLKPAYGELLPDLCRTSTERNRCMDHLQKAGEGPEKMKRMRLVVLTQGWAECAAMPTTKAADAGSDPASVGLKTAIKDKFLKRFKVKTLSCAQ